jgi:hypothetical protein
MGFDNAVGYLVGEPNRGLACMFTMMNNARLSVGLEGVSISERAYQQALEYAFERIQGPAVGTREPGPIIRHADVRRMLMTMKTLTEAGRAIAYDACGSLDFALKADSDEQKAAEKARAALLTPIVKGWCTEVAQEVTSLGVQVHGGMGYVEETGAAQHMRDARVLPIYEGTNGIQAIDLVGRKTLMDKGAALSALLQEMRASIAESNPSLTPQAKQLEEAVAGLERAGEQLLKGAGDDELLPGAIAYNFMMLAGYVCGGWQLLRQGNAVVRLIAEGEDDPYLQAKLESTRFYMAQVLPRWRGHAEMVADGSRSIMALPEALFASAWQ